MNITVRKANILDEKSDLLVFGVFSGTQIFSGTLKTADKALQGLLTDATAEEKFGGKLGDELVLHTHGKLPANRVLLIGLGEKKSFNAEAARRATGSVIRYADKIEAINIVCGLFAANLDRATAAQAVAEGAFLADYKYLSFKPAEAKRLALRKPATLSIIADDAASLHAIEKGIALGEIYARATIYARDLVNEPAGHMTPSHFREHAERIAASDKNIRLKVLDKAACEKKGMNAFLAVAKGSDEPPVFLHMVYRPDWSNKTYKKVAIVGKGLTFDSGGLSLQPAWSQETMKCDMAGAAAVLGLFSVIADIEPDVEVHGLIAACENMPSGKAMHPGDIVTAMNGKSIEVLNTDAEGRLTLADALSYAVKNIKPDMIVDLATLTGACLAALGDNIAALMGNNEKLSSQLKTAAATAGESLCSLPLFTDYAPLIVGDHADLRNIQRGRWGGTVTSGLFLNEFVDNTPWAHLDIAGPAFAERDFTSYINKGGTGYGTRTLLNWLKNL